jgi:hypothetical protein
LHMAQRWNEVAVRDARILPVKEEFARHMARRLNDAAAMDAPMVLFAEEFAGHVVGRTTSVDSRDARSLPSREGFARHTAQWWHETNNSAVVGDAKMALVVKELVADIVQGLMPTPHREKRINIFDHRGSTMPLQWPHLLLPGDMEKSTEPPALYDIRPFVRTFQTMRMKSVLGYGRQVAWQDSVVVVQLPTYEGIVISHSLV